MDRNERVMRFNMLRFSSSSKILFIFLIFLTTSCGYQSKPVTHTNHSSSNQTSTRIPSDTSHTLVKEGTITTQSRGAATFTVGQLNINVDMGFSCSSSTGFNPSLPYFAMNLNPSSYLVLNDDRLSYDSVEVDQMRSYFNALLSTNGAIPPTPNILTWASLAVTQVSNGLTGTCELNIDGTNIGNTPIQIQSIDLRLTSTTQLNNINQYRFIDVCSLAVINPCPPEVGGMAGIRYSFQLQGGEAGTIYTPAAPINGSISQVLNPGDPFSINIGIDSATNLIYPIVPELIVNSNGTSQTLPLTQLATTLFFANPSQISCYSLQGDSFVRVSSIYDSSNRMVKWCV